MRIDTVDEMALLLAAAAFDALFFGNGFFDGGEGLVADEMADIVSGGEAFWGIFWFCVPQCGQ